MTAINPRVTWHLRALMLFELLILVLSGGALYFVPQVMRPQWPWDIPPFNAAFVGAIYLASVPAIALLGFVGRWSPARVILPMLLAFTGIGFIATALNWARFEPGRATTWIWLFLYTAPPLSSALHLWWYRGWPPAEAQPMPGAWRGTLTVAAAGLLLYGLGQFLAPARLSSFWPWPVDDFHGRLYSGSFIAAALGNWLVSRRASRLELMAQALNLLLYGGLAIAGLLGVDRAVQRVNWSSWGTWIWLAAFALMALLGATMLLFSLRLETAHQRVVRGQA
jgi:hypothetical protein